MFTYTELKENLKKIWEAYQHKIAKPNKDALWIFGMQKAGTSAIAGLLAHKANKSITIDTPLLWTPHIQKLQNGEINLKDQMSFNSFDFSKEIIKEPNATYLLDEVQENFNMAKYVFVIRNPFDNIRSILNRLDVEGNHRNIEISKIHPAWRGLFKNNGDDYIIDLAQIWLETYSKDKFINSMRCILVKYEDFKKDKNKTIDKICTHLNYETVNSIDELKNHNFQPKGNPNVDLKVFFGSNYEIINDICGKQMRKFGYK